MRITIKELRERLRDSVGQINPYDLLQIALEFLVNTELHKKSYFVCVDEFREGLQAWAGYRGDSLDKPLSREVRAVEIKILEDPDLWRDSPIFLQWRRRLSEGFERECRLQELEDKYK